MQGFTKLEIKFMQAFRDYVIEQGCSPTYQDLVDMGAAKSKSTVSRVSNQLEQKGVLTRHKHSARGLMIKFPDGCPCCGHKALSDA